MSAPKKYDSAVFNAVLDSLCAGGSPSKASKQFGVPTNTVKYWWRSYNSPRSQNDRRKKRIAFGAVMTICNRIRGTLGQSPAIDYAAKSGGQGAQFSGEDHGHQLIDYTVDVAAAAHDTLRGADLVFFNARLLDQDFDLTAQSEAFMLLQERLGKVFTERELYPVAGYFKTVKQ